MPGRLAWNLRKVFAEGLPPHNFRLNRLRSADIRDTANLLTRRYLLFQLNPLRRKSTSFSHLEKSTNLLNLSLTSCDITVHAPRLSRLSCKCESNSILANLSSNGRF